MSPLPERRKTAEELAELRANLGIPGEAPPPPDVQNGPPVAPPRPKRPGTSATPASPAKPSAPVESEPAPEPKERYVKSLKRSERGPVPPPKAPEPVAGSKLPLHRHSDDELKQLHFSDPIKVPPADRLKGMAARWWTIGFLYSLAVLGLGAAIYGEIASGMPPMDLPDWVAAIAYGDDRNIVLFSALAGAAGMMLLGAGWLAWRRKRSVHHAGFLVIIAVLMITFGLIYFFPQLHGS